MSNSRLVYSTSDGDRRGAATGARDEATQAPQLPDDGIVRVYREKGGRRGKVVTVVRSLAASELAGIVSDLKRLCGAGGAVKQGAIELQGDHREKVAARLESRGYVVKLAGG